LRFHPSSRPSAKQALSLFPISICLSMFIS
jgi:hypothetical protein